MKTEIFETKSAEIKKEELKAVVAYQKPKWYEKLFGMFRRVKRNLVIYIDNMI